MSDKKKELKQQKAMLTDLQWFQRQLQSRMAIGMHKGKLVSKLLEEEWGYVQRAIKEVNQKSPSHFQLKTLAAFGRRAIQEARALQQQKGSGATASTATWQETEEEEEDIAEESEIEDFQRMHQNDITEETIEDDPGAHEPGADDRGADEPGADSRGADDRGADDRGADSRGANDRGADDRTEEGGVEKKEQQ